MSGLPGGQSRHGDASGDSAGTPWARRTLTPSPFAGDDGRVDAGLAAALGAGADPAPVLAALLTARVFVPVVAVAGEVDEASGVDEGADMALPALRSPDGRSALPLFTTVEALGRWDPAARPVPVDARRAALSAVEEGHQLLVLDAAGPVTVVLPRPAVWALAQGQAWTPSPHDPQVLAAVAQAAGSVPGVVAAAGEPGRRAELRVALTVAPGLDAEGLRALTSAVSAALAASEVVAERVDALELVVTAARP